MSPGAQAQDSRAVEARIDLTALPDPRPAVTETVAVTRRLADVLEGAARRFQQAGATVDAELDERRQQARRMPLDAAHLAHRVGAVVDHVDGLAVALADADLQHDSNIRVLATYQRAVAQMRQSTLPSEVRSADGYRDRTRELIVADGDLRQTINRARTFLPSFTVAAHRIAVAAVRLGREQLVAEVTRQVHNARLALNVALSHRQVHEEAERPLRAIIDRLATQAGQVTAVPAIIWPPTGKGSDPFAVPQLKE